MSSKAYIRTSQHTHFTAYKESHYALLTCLTVGPMLVAEKHPYVTIARKSLNLMMVANEIGITRPPP